MKKTIKISTLALGLATSIAANAISAPQIHVNKNAILSISELAADDTTTISHGDHKCGEGKCGEGKCGEGKCGEGKDHKKKK